MGALVFFERWGLPPDSKSLSVSPELARHAFPFFVSYPCRLETVACSDYLLPGPCWMAAARLSFLCAKLLLRCGAQCLVAVLCCAIHKCGKFFNKNR